MPAMQLPSSDILGFSSFFFKTDSMRTLSCLKITAILTGAYKEKTFALSGISYQNAAHDITLLIKQKFIIRFLQT